MKLISKTYFLLGTGFLLCLFSSPLHAYPIWAFDVRGLLDAADVVCYGKVVAVEAHPVEPDRNFSPPVVTAGGMATVQVISLIKGNASARIKVIFRKRALKEMVDYTEITQNESVILFVKSQHGLYHLVDDRNGKLQVPLHKPLAYKSAAPVDRMAAELMFASRVDKGLLQLVCIEQLGDFARPGVVNYLQQLTALPDMLIQGTAYAALIRLDVPPAVTRLAQFFKGNYTTGRWQRLATDRYDTGHVKGTVLQVMESRLNEIRRDLEPTGVSYTADGTKVQVFYTADRTKAQVAAQQWKRFDLIRFLTVAIDNIPSDKDERWMEADSYRDIADMVAYQIDLRGRPAYLNHTYRKGSRSLAVRLLRNANLEVSEAAARAIDGMIVEKHKFPYPQGGRQDTIRYVKTVREWIKQHPQWIKSDR